MPPTSAWFTTPKPNPSAKLRLFCFPFAGGGASTYRTWPDAMLSTVEICAAVPPGREARLDEPAIPTIAPVVLGLADAIASRLDKPFAFFGHSMGAMLAFDLARLLRARGLRLPSILLVSGSEAPHLPRSREPIHHLDAAGFVEGLRRLNGVPAELLENDELFRIFQPTLRADLTLCETYQAAEEPPLPCPIAALGGLEDPDVTREEIAAWKQHTTAAFSVRMLPGDHFFLDSARRQVIEVVAREIYKLGTLR